MKKIVLDVINNVKPGADLSYDQDLVGSGILDSFDLLVLVGDLELACGLEIPGNLITPENFFSINSISKMLKSLKGNSDAS